VPDEIIDEAWGALLLDFPLHKITLLDEARRQYRTFLLSNTNNIHRIKFESRFKEITAADIRDYFENVHYSFEMHSRKPDDEIFQKVIEENCLTPEETLLIDDSLPNIETAKGMGMQTRHVQINQVEIEF
jgi:putative hydrolase of the HAD superfamily